MGGMTALGVNDNEGLDAKVAKRLWSKAEAYTGIVFP